jgi:hypothetical protein
MKVGDIVKIKDIESDVIKLIGHKSKWFRLDDFEILNETKINNTYEYKRKSTGTCR